MRRLGLAAACALLLLPASAAAAPPTITSVKQKDGKITVRWRLASDEYKSDTAELASRPDTGGSEGEFRIRYTEDVVPLKGDQRSATFVKIDRPGAYYVHVSSLKKRCSDDPEDESCITPEWSDVKKIVIPRPPPAKRYRGRTSQGRKISFTVREGRVRNLRIGYATRCTFGRQTGRLTNTGRGLRVRRDRRFSNRVRLVGNDGSRSRVRFGGRLRGKSRAAGTFRLNARGTPAGACSTGDVTWRARAG